MAQKSDKKGLVRGGGGKGAGVKGERREEDEEDYGDYVTRCICGYTHDDGFMVQCDGCSVWQHVECITENANNLPDKYLCELCQPRQVDKKRARLLQQQKREDLADLEENRSSPMSDHRTDRRKPPPHPSAAKRRRKQSKEGDSKPSETKKTKKEKGEGKKGYQKGGGGKGVGSGGGPGGAGRIGSIQCLLNAATLLEGEREVGGRTGTTGSWKELWSADNSPWCDKYDTAEHNRFSDTVRQTLVSRHNQLKTEAVVFSQQEYSSMESHTHPQCRVTEVQRRRMGVVAQVEVPEDELVLEYKGKVALVSAVLSDFSPGNKSLWKQKPCPFVYIYDKISDLDICVDARHYGNLARFIRRSCTPNAELRHFFVDSDLHFGVYATHPISVREEITLPFDFHIEKCDYLLECGCGHKNCWAVRAGRGKGRGRGPEERGDDTHHISIASRGLSKPHPPLLSPTHHTDEDSNSSWTSSSGRKKQRGHSHQSTVGSHGVGGGGEGGSRHDSREVSSDSEEEGGERKKKVKSREERKTEAVMKMFQRMEASSQRKRRHHTSEGSVDSGDAHSPSTLLSHHPLTPSQRAAAGAQRERRGSTSTRRPGTLPQTKLRLSSVSSNEGMSSADLPDTFSPPVTPRLATLSSPHPVSSPIPPSPIPPSPLPTPTTYTHSPTVRFTPDLHPKYLLAQFPMPLKKALLRQWESEKHGGCSGNNGKPRPLWPHDHMTLMAGYVTTVWPSADACVPRPRGCLKHRWLKQYTEETTHDGKENQSSNSRTAAVPLKQRILRRWMDREQGHTPKTSSIAITAPLRGKTTTVHQSQIVSPEKKVTSDGDVKRDSCRSPLFEEFSDNEFDEKEGRGEGRGQGEKKLGPSDSVDDVGKGGDDKDGDFNIQELPKSPVTSEIGDKVESGLTTVKRGDSSLVPTDTKGGTSAPSDGTPSNPAGGVAEVGKSETSGGTETTVEVTRKTKSLEELISEDVEGVGRGEGEMEGYMGRREGEEGVVGRRGGKSLEELMVEDMAASYGGGGPEDILRRGGDGGGSVLVTGADPREMPGQLAGKAPAKRKINLSEYRSRVRKPVDQRRDSISSDHLPSPLPTSTPSFLPPTFTPSHHTPSPYSLLTSVGTPSGTLLGGGVASSALPPPPPPPPPQFEPVSPDDTEPAPILHEGPTHSQQRGLVPVGNMPGHIPLGVIPGVTDPTLAPSTFIPPGSHSTTTYGMEPAWNTPQLEPSQDPRRHVMGGASRGGLLPHPQPHIQPQPGAPPHVMMSQPGPAPAHQPRPLHGFGPTPRPPMFHPRHPPGGGGGFY